MDKQKMKKKGLDTLGWLVAFPVQVTKKLTKRKGGKTKRKAATIAAAWAMYLGLATAGVTSVVNSSRGGNEVPGIEQVSPDNQPAGNQDNQSGNIIDPRSELTDWWLEEETVSMECHLYYRDRSNMEFLPKDVYCVTKINGEDFRNDWIVEAGDTLTIETTVLDSRSPSRGGSTKYTYTVEDKDLYGFELSFNATLSDRDDPNYRQDILLVYSFSPIEQEEPGEENKLPIAVTDQGVLVGGFSSITVVGTDNSKVIYSSSDTSVATVSREGSIEGKSPGRAVISVREIGTGRTGEVTVWVGEPHWCSIDSYVMMEDGRLDESEWEVMTLINDKIGYTANDILPGDTYSYTLRVQRKSDPDEVFEKQIAHVICEGDYEFGFVVPLYLPVTVMDDDGTGHVEYFFAAFDGTVITE
ncbi:MAG: Ig-like domain-containing protein [Lachnospiraceae bacterium]|nr:Ig-like domain-containing protein [Lachnospiraceae bacterium]